LKAIWSRAKLGMAGQQWACFTARGYADYTRKKMLRARETVKKFFRATECRQANNGGRYRKFIPVAKALPFTPRNAQFILKIH
jgi:hypothetical protein